MPLRVWINETIPERGVLEGQLQALDTAIDTFITGQLGGAVTPGLTWVRTEIAAIITLLDTFNTTPASYTEGNVQAVINRSQQLEWILRRLTNTFIAWVRPNFETDVIAVARQVGEQAENLEDEALQWIMRRTSGRAWEAIRRGGRSVRRNAAPVVASVALLAGSGYVGKKTYDYLTIPPGNTPEVVEAAPTVKDLVDTHFTIQPGVGNAERDSYHAFWQALRNITKSRPGQWVWTDGHINLNGTKAVGDKITLYADEDGDKEVITINWKNNKGKAGKSIFEQSWENGSIMYRTGDKGISSRPISLAEMKKLLDDYANY